MSLSRSRAPRRLRGRVLLVGETRFQHRGLRVAYQPHPGALTAIALTVRAGARFDGRHPGLAHMAEHMLFQGTARLDQIALNHRAAELGGEHNADTGYEDISLTIEVFNEDVGDALALLAEQYYHTRVDPKRFRKERRVVLEEIRGRIDDPADRVYRRAWSALFEGPLASPVSGTLASVRGIEASDVAGFLRRYFDHANTALAVVGGVPFEEVCALVQRHFHAGGQGAVHRTPRVSTRSGRWLEVRDTSSSQAYLVKLIPVSPDPAKLLAVAVALDLVGADPDSHLFQELRERLGLTYEVSATLEWGPDWAVVVLCASAARAQAGRLVRAVEQTWRRTAESGFTPEELLRARRKSRYRYALLADSRLDQALTLADSMLWGFPTPHQAEQIVVRLTRAEIEAGWREAMKASAVTALLR
jgi:predicted Zn-dependent peptidase